MGFMNRDRDCNHGRGDKTIVSPTETVVNTRTNVRTIRHIHPTEVINVNRNVIRNEHFYPVTEREVNETVVEDFDCGRDVNNPRCRPRNNRPRPRWI
jgi:spore coat protein D